MLYLELLPPRCEEAEPDLATLGCICGLYYPADRNFEPSWLAGSSLAWFEEVTLRLPPEAGLHFPPLGSIIRTTGHFSDPASTTCVLNPAKWDSGDVAPTAAEGGGPDPRIAELYCREQFVVDGYDIIGTDPDFPYPSGA